MRVSCYYTLRPPLAWALGPGDHPLDSDSGGWLIFRGRGVTKQNTHPLFQQLPLLFTDRKPSNIQLRYNGASFFMSTPKDDLLPGAELNKIPVMTRLGPLSLMQGGPPPVSGRLGMCWKSCQKCDDCPRSPDSHLIPALIALYHATMAPADIYFTNHYSWSHVTHHPGDRQVQVQVHIMWVLLFHIWCFDKVNTCFAGKGICFWEGDTECKWPLMLSVIWPVSLLVRSRKRNRKSLDHLHPHYPLWTNTPKSHSSHYNWLRITQTVTVSSGKNFNSWW